MGDTDSFYSESNESLIDEIFGTISRNRSLRRDEVKGKGAASAKLPITGHFRPKTACIHQESMRKMKF